MAGARGSRRVEQVLARAVSDDDFARELLERRSKAAVERGWELSPSERGMLDSIPEPQLRAMLQGLTGSESEGDWAPAPPAGPDGDLSQVLCGGIRPDLPEEGPGNLDRPRVASHGIRPDVPASLTEQRSPIRGHSIALPVAAAGMAIVAAGAIAATCCMQGMRADVPPAAAPSRDKRSDEGSTADPQPAPAPSTPRKQAPEPSSPGTETGGRKP